MSLVWVVILFIQVVCPSPPVPSLSRPGGTVTQLSLETTRGMGERGGGGERVGEERPPEKRSCMTSRKRGKRGPRAGREWTGQGEPWGWRDPREEAA